MGGKPCIRGMRVTVGMIVGQIGAGLTIEELLADYPYLEREDVFEALRYAAWRAQEREIDLAPTEWIGPAVLAAIEQTRRALEVGALVPVDAARARLRLLPLGQEDSP